MNEIAMPGLDGSSLLGFVGGIGALDVLCSTRVSGQMEPRLGWRRNGTWQPVVTGPSSLEELAVRVLDDAKCDAVERVLAFRYVKMEKQGPKGVGSLVAPLAVFRASVQANISEGCWRTAEALASLMCESVTEPMDDKAPSADDLNAAGVDFDRHSALDQAVSPTPFDFTSRNTQFLDQIRRVRDVLTVEIVLADLLHGTGSPSDRIMRWDALVDMPGALFDRSAPMSRPTAEWLVFRGTALFNLVANSGRVRMAGFSGRRKAGELSWGLWDSPLTRDVIRTALGVRWASMDRPRRMARGVSAGFTVSMRKDATGYDGSVSPSRPAEVRRN